MVMNLSARGIEERPITRLSLHGQVVERLREMIVENDLVAGDKVDEKALCQAFGISRTPLREALKVLASEGLIELLPNRSPRVAPITRENVDDLFEVLGWLERHAGELAAPRATEKDLQRLWKVHKRMVRLHRQGERIEYFRMNRVLHTTIVETAGNPVLTSIYSNLMVQIQRARYIAIQSQNHWDRGVKEHSEILDALAGGDGEELGILLMNHVRETGNRVKTAFDSSGEGAR